MSLRSLLCRVIGHRWESPAQLDAYYPPVNPRCQRCGQIDPAVPTSPSPRPGSSSYQYRMGEVRQRPAVWLEEPPRGTAVTAPPVPEATPEGSTPQRVQRSVGVTGADEWSSYELTDEWYEFNSSTRVAAPTVGSSTSTPTHSSVSDRSVGEC